ncbi:MAG: hypothetical protein AUK44_03325 [Porphyromonadaceae bacterium CG2_30_38_12]|nr:MAG: hypothetical protein AUK44_03325 [Porphyromonadaceae bacterium CG2_30_38_12]
MLKKNSIKISILRFSLLGFLVFTFEACKTLQIEKPRESYIPTNLAPASSELPLQVSIDIQKLQNTVNKKMTGLLFDGDKINNQDLSVKIWKAQNFTFSIKNNVIEYRVPLKLWTRFAWNVQKFGITIGDNYEANGSLALTYKTTIEIDKNWKLVSKTASSGFQWIETPKLNVVGVQVPVTPLANLALSKSEQLISDQIDATLQQMVDIKKYVSMAWNETQKPMQVNEANNLWVRITPKDLYISPFQTIGQKLNISIALSALIESYMGAKPNENKATPLPAFKLAQRTAQDFNLNIAADATYAKISEMAKAQLVNKTFSEGKKTITITDLSLFGSEGKPVFMADVIGSIKGRIYFTGNLVYNAEKIAIEVENPSFDMQTKNVLAKSANWLLNGMIIKKITPYLTYSVKQELDELKADANKTLSNYKIYDGITLIGKLNSMNVQSVTLVPGAVRLNANVKGKIALKVDELNF